MLSVTKNGLVVGLLPLVGDEKPRLFLQTPVATYAGQFCPEGRWVAYTAKESGREDVYVVAFDAAGLLKSGTDPANAVSVDGKWQISTDGGSSPDGEAADKFRRSRQGKSIFFREMRYWRKTGGGLPITSLDSS